MGGVDIADQLRGYHSTQLTSRRNWMPLFFWLLDIVLVNSFQLAKLKGWSGSQVAFREELLWGLVKITEKEEEEEEEDEEEVDIQVQPSTKKLRVTKNFTIDNLPAARLKAGNHFPNYNSDRKTCVWCSFQSNGNDWEAFKTQVSCELCDVYLCFNKTRNCFKNFHTLDS
jgi:hypothetical protein